MSQGINKPDEMDTLSECLTHAVRDGFTTNFKAIKLGEHYNLWYQDDDGEHVEEPETISIKTFYRFEGASDPSDNAILYLIETIDGERGTLVDAYGVDADPTVGEFIKLVEDIQKQKMKDI